MTLRQFLFVEPVIAVSYLVGCGGRDAGVRNGHEPSAPSLHL
jgi:hypothetical protein